TLSTNIIGEDFSQIYPDYRALRKCEKCNVRNQQPEQSALMTCGEKDAGDSRKTPRCSHRTDQEQGLASHLVDDGHRHHGENQIGSPDGHGLQIARYFAEPGLREDVIEVIKNHIDA